MAQRTPRQNVAGQLGKQFPTACVDGYIATTLNDFSSIPINVLVLTQKGQRLVADIQSHLDNLRTLSYKQPFVRLKAVAQLGFGKGTEYLHTGMGQR